MGAHGVQISWYQRHHEAWKNRTCWERQRESCYKNASQLRRIVSCSGLYSCKRTESSPFQMQSTLDGRFHAAQDELPGRRREQNKYLWDSRRIYQAPDKRRGRACGTLGRDKLWRRRQKNARSGQRLEVFIRLSRQWPAPYSYQKCYLCRSLFKSPGGKLQFHRRGNAEIWIRHFRRRRWSREKRHYEWSGKV